jgi:hypothetical protein
MHNNSTQSFFIVIDRSDRSDFVTYARGWLVDIGEQGEQDRTGSLKCVEGWGRWSWQYDLGA